MKVIAFNGSPRKKGNTSRLVDLAFKPLNEAGIETERIDICKHRPRGCIACMKCAENQNRQCVLTDDPVNEWIAKMVDADGIIFASPTYFANVSAEMKALIDRAGFVARVNGNLLARKVGASIVAVRRGGAVPAFDAMNHMMQINEMILVGSIYWNFGFGMAPGEVESDDEGVRTMANLGENMAWLLKRLA
jgi:multimeric flavodoxin WrbA